MLMKPKHLLLVLRCSPSSSNRTAGTTTRFTRRHGSSTADGRSLLVRGDEEGERVVRTDRTPDGLDLELVLKAVCAVLAMAKLSKRNYAE